MNNITIAGRIGKDIEIRRTNSGEAVGGFSVADDQGKDKPTIWWNCQLWGARAEALAPYLTKGASVTVTGRVQEREYTDLEGQKRKAQEIRVNDIALQGGRPDSRPSAPAPRQQARRASAPARSQGGAGGFSDMDDDIPFADPMKRRAFALAI